MIVLGSLKYLNFHLVSELEGYIASFKPKKTEFKIF